MANNDPAANNDTLSSSPGQLLRRCREFQNISLQDASEVTKISKNYLKALEEDRPEEFGNRAYLKGFLKIYAAYLGLNVDDILRVMEKTSIPQENIDKQQMPEKRIESRRRIWKRLLLPAILLVAIVLTAIFQTPSRLPVVTTKSPIPPAPAPAVLKPLSNAINPLNQQNAKTIAPSPSTPTSQTLKDGLVVHMKVLKNGNMTVALDNATPQPYELSSGDIIEWKADRSISMELSDGGGVELSIPGKPAQLAGPAGKAISIVIDSTGIKR